MARATSDTDFAHVCMLTVLTLLLQATTIEFLMERLGMFAISKGTSFTREETKGVLVEKGLAMYAQICCGDPVLGDAIPAIVGRLTGLSISELVSLTEEANASSHVVNANADGESGDDPYAERGSRDDIEGMDAEGGRDEEEAAVGISDEASFTIEEHSAGINSRVTSILSEGDLKRFGAPQSLTLEALRPYLADLEIRFLNGVLASYKNMREHQILTARTELILHQSVDHALDTPEMVDDWVVLSPFCRYRRKRKLEKRNCKDESEGLESQEEDKEYEEHKDEDEYQLQGSWKVTRFLISMINFFSAAVGLSVSFDEIYLGVQLAAAYLTARNSVYAHIKRTVEHARSDSEEGRNIAFSRLILKCLKKEMDLHDEDARRYLSAVRSHRPYVLAAVRSEQVAARVLFSQKELLESLRRDGLLLEAEFNDLLGPLLERDRKIHNGARHIREAERLFLR